jgi:HEAT repeat protein
MPRLKSKSWYLTKQVWTFRPEEMHDLEFQPALPVLAAALPSPAGGAAAGVLWHLGAPAVPILISACGSTNAIERINASSVLQSFQGKRLVEPLLTLLKDEVPEVRYHAVMATVYNWDPCFADPLIALFGDPYFHIRVTAVQSLGRHESAGRVPIYLDLLKDPNPDVQWGALIVVSGLNRQAIPRADLLRLLGSSRLETVSLALNLLGGYRSRNLPPGAWNQPLPPSAPEPTNHLSSVEAAPLTTNQLTMARLMGLKVLRENADAQAVALALPLLRDTNSIVRHRAFALLQTVSGQDIPQDDPAKWEQWWAANKATFKATKPAR